MKASITIVAAAVATAIVTITAQAAMQAPTVGTEVTYKCSGSYD